MIRRRMAVGFGCVALAVATLGGCGGSDDSGDDGAAPSEPASEGGADDGADATDATTDDGDGGDGDATAGPTADTGSNDDGDDQGDDADGGGDTDQGDGGDFRCDDIFAMSEIEEWFGEPAELTEERMDSIGQVVCNWETIEDPAATDDFAFQLITAQIFTGEGVPAENFVDPEIFEEVTPIDGLGDLAFRTEDLGQTYYFLDDGIAGVFSVSDVDMGDVDAPKRHTADDVEAFFRDFHARVIG